MNFDDGINPFADTRRQPTSPTVPNKQNYDYNPFTSTTTPAQPAQSSEPSNTAAYLSPSQHPAYQPPTQIPTPTPTPVAVQKPTEQHGNDTKPTSTRIDLGPHNQRQTELDEREKRLAEREQALANQGLPASRVKNFPPFPKFCPCGPCFIQDINVDIASQFQRWVRFIFYLWLFYSLTLFLNLIGTMSWFIVDVNAGQNLTDGGTAFGLSIVYFLLFIPLTYICWFRPIYRAFSGFIRMGLMSINKFVGVLMIILGCFWAFISIAAIFLTIRVHQLYRQSGASLEQAQKEFRTAFVNNSTVRGAAREVAAAGINEAIRTDRNQTIY